MKTLFVTLLYSSAILLCGCAKGGNGTEGKGNSLSERNMLRAMEIIDAAVAAQFGTDMLLSEYYNPFTGQLSGTGGSDASIWKYTAAIEAVNAVMHGLTAHKESGNAALYDDNYPRYADLLGRLYDKTSYYRGTFTLTSFTQTKEWSVYAVPRASTPNSADVVGDRNRGNVYDDQMWLIRELISSYRLTGKSEYLTEAEYLTAYVLDGWDCTLDAEGTEHGGIFWGPGYVTKHTCSNGPMVSPLVWLHEIYKGKADEITYLYIDTDKSRKTRTVKKSDYYLDFAKRTYDWTKKWLIRPDGVYHDMRGGYQGSDGYASYEVVDGTSYRKYVNLTQSVGTAYSYNAGSMLSGVCDLYRVTGEAAYRADAVALSDASFDRFSQKDANRPGYYSWSIALNTYSAWHNGILMRAYEQARGISEKAVTSLDSFQQNLDYAYEHFCRKGFLPVNLVAGWGSTENSRVNIMATSAFAAEYAILAIRELETASM